MEDRAICLGHPSYLWRFGQERRLALINEFAPLSGRRILDVGCGLGMYLREFRRFSDEVYGVDVDLEKVAEAIKKLFPKSSESQTRKNVTFGKKLPNIQVAKAEYLPFPEGFFDVVLLHEVIEHVSDDAQAIREAVRVLRSGGRLVIFAPNRLWPWETHGIFFGGRYRFGNYPLVNYLPNILRKKLAGHVRIYTKHGMKSLFKGLDVRIIHHSTIYPGFDNLASRRPALARLARKFSYTFEKIPLLRALGLSHFLVVEKLEAREIKDIRAVVL
jgi:SAM-dependent methyltransferase